MAKDMVGPIVHNKFQFDPPDADYTWVAKVMLLACPNREDLIAKTCHLAGIVVHPSCTTSSISWQAVSDEKRNSGSVNLFLSLFELASLVSAV